MFLETMLFLEQTVFIECWLYNSVNMILIIMHNIYSRNCFYYFIYLKLNTSHYDVRFVFSPVFAETVYNLIPQEEKKREKAPR